MQKVRLLVVDDDPAVRENLVGRSVPRDGEPVSRGQMAPRASLRRTAPVAPGCQNAETLPPDFPTRNHTLLKFQAPSRPRI